MNANQSKCMSDEMEKRFDVNKVKHFLQHVGDELEHVNEAVIMSFILVRAVLHLVDLLTLLFLLLSSSSLPFHQSKARETYQLQSCLSAMLYLFCSCSLLFLLFLVHFSSACYLCFISFLCNILWYKLTFITIYKHDSSIAEDSEKKVSWLLHLNDVSTWTCTGCINMTSLLFSIKLVI